MHECIDKQLAKIGSLKKMTLGHKLFKLIHGSMMSNLEYN